MFRKTETPIASEERSVIQFLYPRRLSLPKIPCQIDEVHGCEEITRKDTEMGTKF